MGSIKDEHSIFGEYVVNQLLALNDKGAADMVRFFIEQVIFRANIGMLSQDDAQGSSTPSPLFLSSTFRLPRTRRCDARKPSREEYSAYGEHLANQMRTFQNGCTASVVRAEIDRIIFKAVIELQEDDSVNQQATSLSLLSLQNESNQIKEESQAGASSQETTEHGPTTNTCHEMTSEDSGDSSQSAGNEESQTEGRSTTESAEAASTDAESSSSSKEEERSLDDSFDETWTSDDYPEADHLEEEVEIIFDLNAELDNAFIQMEIFVNTPDNKTLTLQVESNYTIDRVKLLIMDKEGLLPCHQRLTFANKSLAGWKTLSDYSIMRHSTLELSLGKGMQIFVLTLQGRTITFDVEPDELVESLKKKLEEKNKTPAEYIRLFFGGKELKNNETLATYGIQKESTIHETSRMLGGSTLSYYVL